MTLPPTCTTDGCTRKARSKSSTVCHTCYMRARRREAGTEPRLPVAPLRAFAEGRGKGHLVVLQGAETPLSTADRLCCEELGVHPTAVYGDLYFAAA